MGKEGAELELRPESLEVLFDTGKTVGWIAELTRQPESTVRDRLCDEFEHSGISVSRAMVEAGLSPHVWTDDLARFYQETDAFLYELLVWNRNKLKQKMRRWVGRHLAGLDGQPLDILSVGDGLGFDSAYLALAGHRVTYFEVSGYSESFARKVFTESGAGVTVITDRGKISPGAYDAVVCLDVLEHVPDPRASVKELVSYLRPGGSLIVHAPFYFVCSRNPTHLKANRRYSGDFSLFQKEGLEFVDGGPLWNPLVLRKGEGRCLSRLSPKRIGLEILRWYQAQGRLYFWPFWWMLFLIQLNNVKDD